MPTRSLILAAIILLTTNLNATSLRDRVGVAHAGGKYTVGSHHSDYLTEGAQLIRYGLGSRVIKLWLAREPAQMYSFNSPAWQESRIENDLTRVAGHEYFQNVFAMPFSTYILVVDAPHLVWFGDGMSKEEEQAEERVFYDLTRYLIQTYSGSGKTFILQNWEGDWLLHLDGATKTIRDDREPSPIAVAGMIRWLNARQRGVSRAREELAHVSNVTVKHAVEVNQVWRAKFEPWRITVTNDVLPAVNADMYSYSAWEASADLTGLMLVEMLAWLDDRTPGQGNIYVGEYGAPENSFGSGEHSSRVVAQTHAALDWGAAYVIYWQIYCNEFAEGSGPEHPGAILNSDMRGFWLVRPDGTRSPAWHFLRSLLRPAAAPVVRMRPERAN